MIKIEHVETAGWGAALRGMRNPMNSWAKSDSGFGTDFRPDGTHEYCEMGPNDKNLAMKLRNAGVEHRKYMRMIAVWCDITAPLYWWKQFDTYKIGTVANSCSTMHKIHAKEFTAEDFSCEDIIASPYEYDTLVTLEWSGVTLTPKHVFELTIQTLNKCREQYLETRDPRYWYSMIEQLPDSYNQKRTVMLNYEVLAKMYKERRHHKLQEWHDLCDWMKTLPASELIMGEE